ncbi:MAG: thioredoxin domain-containing protein [Phycisphaeraceae bacterium]|nr:thioredoxin domain-containing protein [Phycisphaeraceae bacterium]
MTRSDATIHDQPLNRLAGETSPYLLQHAHNPVDWHPWGPQAIEEARRLQKPIFLSIGYSTCYWCHVMERQVFENEPIARQMNEGFICIKVDREERPDLDEVYMAAVQLTTGHGGWPMSVFLTPPPEAPPPPPPEADAGDLDGKGLLPFYAGTYFPPEPTHGMPSFPQVLAAVSDAWRNRPQDVRRQAVQVAQAVREHLGTQAQAEAETTQLSPDVVQRAANQLLRGFDPEHGGFGRAPKFPQPSNLLFLMRIQQQSPNADLAGVLRLTLERMARGGMHDQVGGGFHRYSVDEKWLVPHFEKMLYDNAQLIEAYLVGQTVVPDEHDAELYPRVVRETADYVLREMTGDDGAFYSAQDAEVDSREGQNYLWTPPEIEKAMSLLPREEETELARLATAMFGLDQGANFRDPHHADAPAANVLYLPTRLDDLAAARGLTMAQVLEQRRLIRQRLLEVRMQRPQPRTDDKAIASWNGMMIAALAMAGRVLGEPRYVKAAERAAKTILEKMRQSDGSLLRTMRAGEAKIPAFLEDYAFLTHGLIELGQAAGDPAWVRHAQALTDKAIDLFDAGRDHHAGGAGGFFDTLADQADLFVRVRSTYDGALPGGNSQMVHNMLDLFELTGQATYLRLAARTLQSFAGPLARQGHGMVHMQHALMRAMVVAPYLFGTTQAEQTTGGDAMTAEVSPNPLDLSEQDVAVVRLRLVGGYHVHAHDLDEPGLTPTTLELTGGDGLAMQVEYPPAVERRYPLADRPLRVYEGEVAIKARFAAKCTSDTKEVRAVLVLRAQPCTEQACLQAQELAIPMTVIRR